MTAAKATGIEWYLGRDGTQYGPLNDVEMRKLFELGHLRANDLVWRQGFAEWLPAPEVFQASPAPADPPGSADAAEPYGASPQTGFADKIDDEPAPAEADADADDGKPADPGGAMETVEPAWADTPPIDSGAPPPEERPASAGWQPEAAAMSDSVAAEPAAAAPARAQRQLEPAGPQGFAQEYSPVFEPERLPQRELAPAAPRAEPAHWAAPAPGYAPAGPAGRSERGYAAAYGASGSRPVDPGGLPASPDDLFAPPAEAEAPRRRVKVAKAPRPSQKSTRRIVATLVVTALLIAAGVGGYLYRDALADVAGRAGQQVAALMGRTQEPGAQRPAAVRTPAAVQPSGLWQLVKAEFPEWYAERTREAAKIRVETKDERAAVRFLTEALVALRRSQADAALASSPESIRKIASTFVANLDELKKASVEHCYTYISLGEANARILELADVKSATATIEAQIGAVFEAIAEGRRQPQVHLPPRKGDYDLLADELVRRGWSDSDLQVFSDPRQLARASPARVCGMVRDWFAAHLALQDPNVQLRLLIESLKPVVAG